MNNMTSFLNNLSFDWIPFFKVLIVILILVGVYVIFAGRNRLQESRKVMFVTIRKKQVRQGTTTIFIGLIMILLAAFYLLYGEVLVVEYIPMTITPSATPTTTLTPTITMIPTITLTPTLTPTLDKTYTPVPTKPPSIPEAVLGQFENIAQPNPDTIFSPLVFGIQIDSNYQILQPKESFPNPVGHMYATFTYDGMAIGSQWTALWYYNNDLVHFETMPWNAGTGGIGYTDWEPDPSEWLAGQYQVSIFLGEQWKITGGFLVTTNPIE